MAMAVVDKIDDDATEQSLHNMHELNLCKRGKTVSVEWFFCLAHNTKARAPVCIYVVAGTRDSLRLL